MGFKLGKARQPYMTNRKIKSTLSFNKQAGDPNASVPGTPVIRKPLDEGILGEANMDGTIFISDKIVPGSEEERQVINHEMRPSTDMKLGNKLGTKSILVETGVYNSDTKIPKELNFKIYKDLKDFSLSV